MTRNGTSETSTVNKQKHLVVLYQHLINELSPDNVAYLKHALSVGQKNVHAFFVSKGSMKHIIVPD